MTPSAERRRTAARAGRARISSPGCEPRGVNPYVADARGAATRISATIAVAVAVVTSPAGPHRGRRQLLFPGSLQRPSAAIKQQQAAGLSIAFVNHQLLIKSIGSGFVFLAPRFSSNGSRLAAVHVDVDVSLARPPSPALLPRAQRQLLLRLVVDNRPHPLDQQGQGRRRHRLASENIASPTQYTSASNAPARPARPDRQGAPPGRGQHPKEGDKATFTDAARVRRRPGRPDRGRRQRAVRLGSFSNLTVRQG